MDIALLCAICALLALLLLGVFYLRASKAQQQAEVKPRAQPVRAREGVPRRAQVVRNRNVRQRANAQQAQQVVVDDSDNDDNAADEDSAPARPVPDFSDAKIGAKKRAKLEAKAEKKAQRESEEQLRQEKKKRELKVEEEMKRIEDEEREKELKIQEEEKRLREEKERKEHEEYLKMKEAFSVEEEGYEENEPEDGENLLQQFVAAIKDQKVVILEDLAAQFKLKTQAAIDRIKDLQNDDLLTGVIDDRGKFIYISHDEMEAMAKFIKQRGRVSIAELAENSNQLINLTPVNCL